MAKISFLLVIPLALLALALSACENRSQNDLGKNENAGTSTVEPLSNKTEPVLANPGSPKGLTELLDLVETLDPEKKREAVARFEETVKSDPMKRAQIIPRLMGDIQEICVDQGRVIESETLFQKVGTMSMILSDLQSMEALDVLIDCSNHTRPAGTDGVNEFATMGAIIKYKEKALPALKMKLQRPANDMDGKLLKCSISSTLSAIGGRKAEQILVEAKKNETDGEVLSCISRSLAGIRVHLKGM